MNLLTLFFILFLFIFLIIPSLSLYGSKIGLRNQQKKKERKERRKLEKEKTKKNKLKKMNTFRE
jgi:hypothetical protein